MPNEKRLGQYLVDAGVISEEQLESALDRQDYVDKKIGEVLIERDLITEKELVKFLSRQTGYMVVNLDNYSVENEALEFLSEEQARNYNAVPIAREGDRLKVAMQDPFDLSTVDDLSMVTDMEIEPAIATRSEIERYIDQAYNSESVSDESSRPIKITGSAPGEYDELTAPDVAEDDRSVDNVINRVLRDALENRATNIHFNPKSNKVQLQFRIDNVIHHYTDLPKNICEKIHSRLFMVAEQTGEQSDRQRHRTIRLQYGSEDVILRLQDVDTQFGRKLMIEVHRGQNYDKSLDSLGLSESDLDTLRNLLDVPRGLIIFSGPNNSGRTCSLYASLQYLCRQSTSPLTVEDPIKYDLEFCPQTQVEPGDPEQKKRTMNRVLETDPDILIVSNVNDPSVMKRALEAAHQGRKVLVTCGGESAPDVLYQLTTEPKIDPSKLAQSLVAVVNQRLIRIPKEHYLEVYQPDPHLLKQLNLPEDNVYYRVDKEDMGPNYYQGMTGLFQIMPFREELKKCVLDGADYSEFLDASQEILSLRFKGVEKIKEGKTTIEEVRNATYREDLLSGRGI